MEQDGKDQQRHGDTSPPEELSDVELADEVDRLRAEADRAFAHAAELDLLRRERQRRLWARQYVPDPPEPEQ